MKRKAIKHEGLKLDVRKILFHQSNLRSLKRHLLPLQTSSLFPLEDSGTCIEDCLAVSDTSLPTSCCYWKL